MYESEADQASLMFQLSLLSSVQAHCRLGLTLTMLRQRIIRSMYRIYHPKSQEITEETFRLPYLSGTDCIAGSQAWKGLTLDEGNILRKVLTKKGTGKNSVKAKLHTKFIKGCIAKKD